MDENDVFRKTKTSCSDRRFGDVENGIEKSDVFTFLFINFLFVGGIVAAFSFGKMYENVAFSGCWGLKVQVDGGPSQQIQSLGRWWIWCFGKVLHAQMVMKLMVQGSVITKKCKGKVPRYFRCWCYSVRDVSKNQEDLGRSAPFKFGHCLNTGRFSCFPVGIGKSSQQRFVHTSFPGFLLTEGWPIPK